MIDISFLIENGWCFVDKSSFLPADLINFFSNEVENLFKTSNDEKLLYECNIQNIHDGWREPNSFNKPTEVWQIRKLNYEKYLPKAFHNLGFISFSILDKIFNYIEHDFKSLSLNSSYLTASSLFDSMKNGINTVRFLKYHRSHSKDKSGFSEHTDFGVASFFFLESSPGLEIMDKNGNWHTAGISDGKSVLAFGDMMNHITNGQIPAALHRVSSVNLSRFSVAYFIQPTDNFVISSSSNGSITCKVFMDHKFQSIVAAASK